MAERGRKQPQPDAANRETQPTTEKKPEQSQQTGQAVPERKQSGPGVVPLQQPKPRGPKAQQEGSQERRLYGGAEKGTSMKGLNPQLISAIQSFEKAMEADPEIRESRLSDWLDSIDWHGLAKEQGTKLIDWAMNNLVPAVQKQNALLAGILAMGLQSLRAYLQSPTFNNLSTAAGDACPPDCPEDHQHETE